MTKLIHDLLFCHYVCPGFIYCSAWKPKSALSTTVLFVWRIFELPSRKKMRKCKNICIKLTQYWQGKHHSRPFIPWILTSTNSTHKIIYSYREWSAYAVLMIICHYYIYTSMFWWCVLHVSDRKLIHLPTIIYYFSITILIFHFIIIIDCLSINILLLLLLYFLIVFGQINKSFYRVTRVLTYFDLQYVSTWSLRDKVNYRLNKDVYM